MTPPDNDNGRHSSNHAVILSTSRYWFNYRHVNNALAIYHLLHHQGGIPDENIIVMLADEIPVNPRNPKKNGMYVETTASGRSGRSTMNLLQHGVEIDYRGDQVTVESLSRVLLGLSNKHDRMDGSFDVTSSSSTQRTLQSDQDSHLLLYWTGHGGDGFFKFQDVEEITAQDIQRLLQRMHETHRYKEVLFMVDTCQAFTLSEPIVAPNVYTLGSSLRGENSYAHSNDFELGVSVIERYTYAIFEFLQRQSRKSSTTLQQALVDHLRYEQQRAHVGVRQDRCRRNMTHVPLSDFFANVQSQDAHPHVQRLYNNSNMDLNRSALVSPLVQRREGSKLAKVSLGRPLFQMEDIPNGWVRVAHENGLMQPCDWSFWFLVVSFMGMLLVLSRKW